MSINRRSFLKSSAAAAAALHFPAVVRAQNQNSNLQVATVGTNRQALADLTRIGSHAAVKFVGFCDVDTSQFEKADEKFPGVPHFQDFRQMFADLGDKFDAVLVAIPDHMHAFVALDAMRRGKHVYCEKPLTHTVWEARQMRLQAAKSKVVTQMGNQIHSNTEYRTAVRLIRDGVIGKIKEVHSWQSNPGNHWTHLTAPPPPGEVPASLKWDLWLGTAPHREFAPGVYHPFTWRDWQHFGSGTMGDFGCHILDPVFTALELTAPISLTAENDGINEQTWPNAETVKYLFPGSAWTTDKTLSLTWYDGGRKPAPELTEAANDKKLPGSGSLFVGEGGSLILPHVGMPRLYPVEKFASYEMAKQPAGDHYHAWVDAILGGTKTTAGFDYAGPLTEAVQLGNVATRVPGVTLQWEPEKMRIPNRADAEKLLTKVYRKGWEIEAVA